MVSVHVDGVQKQTERGVTLRVFRVHVHAGIDERGQNFSLRFAETPSVRVGGFQKQANHGCSAFVFCVHVRAPLNQRRHIEFKTIGHGFREYFGRLFGTERCTRVKQNGTE